MATAAEPMTMEKAAATFIARMEGFLGDDGPWNRLEGRVKSIEETEKVKLELPKVRDELEKIRATQERLADAIRHSRGPGYIPGLEGEKFSLVRAIAAAKFGPAMIKEKTGISCDHEMEVMTKAAQVIGDPKYGGLMVPMQVIPDIVAAIYTRSVMINLAGDGTTRVTVMPNLTGGEVKITKFGGGIIAYWVGEEKAITESVAKVGDLTLKPKRLGALIRITEILRMLALPSFESMIRRDISRALAKKVDKAILYGQGSDNEPRGVINVTGTAAEPGQGIKVFSAQSRNSGELGAVALTANPPFQATWTGAELEFDAMSDMQLALEEDDVEVDASAAWISSPRFFQRLKQRKIEHYASQPATDGKMYMLGIPFIPDAALADVIGTFGKGNQIAKAGKPGASVGATATGDAKFGDVFFGNWVDVIFGMWDGISFTDDGGVGSGFPLDQTYIKARTYCDVGCREPRGIIVCPDARIYS